MVFSSRTRVFAVTMILFVISCFSPSIPALMNDQPIRTMVNLLVIHVSVLDFDTQRPVQGLSFQDFEVFDNGVALQPVVFRSEAGSEPTTIWFLLSCSPRSSGKVGAPMSSGALKPVLANPKGTYTFGVADWCGADANIDLSPIPDREATLSAIDATLRRTSVESSGKPSTLGFQRLLRQIIDAANLQNERTQTAIVVLNGEKVLMGKEEADLTSKRLLYDSIVLYQVRTRPNESAQQFDSLEFICKQTGGGIYLVEREAYGEAIDSILDALRLRYTIGVYPAHGFDHQWHQVRVQLTKITLQHQKSAYMAYGAGYLAATSPYSISNYQQVEDPSVIEEKKAPDLDFAADAYAFAGLDHLVEFDLRLKSDRLTWGNSSDGHRQARIVMTFISYSEEGRPIARSTVRFEILRDEAHLPITGDIPFTHSDAITLPDNVSRVRMAVSDVGTGRMGFQDFSMREVLAGPRKPAVIR